MLQLQPLPRKLFFTTQVNQDSVSNLAQKIIEINDADGALAVEAALNGFTYSPAPIEIYIDSYGGNVYQILGVVSIIEKSKTPVHTICTGIAASCGFILLISGHFRSCFKYSTLMYHQVSNWSEGTLKHIKERIGETERLQNILEKLTLEKTKIKKTRLKEVFDKEIDWFISPDDAKRLGVVDEVI